MQQLNYQSGDEVTLSEAGKKINLSFFNAFKNDPQIMKIRKTSGGANLVQTIQAVVRDWAESSKFKVDLSALAPKDTRFKKKEAAAPADPQAQATAAPNTSAQQTLQESKILEKMKLLSGIIVR